MDALITVVLLGFMAWREYRHDIERRELYSRLMAKDLTDYSVSTSTKELPRPQSYIKHALERLHATQRLEGGGSGAGDN